MTFQRIEGATVITGAHDIRTYQMMVWKSALGLEMKGLKRRGRSVYSIVQDQLGLRGTRKHVLEQLCKIIEERKHEGA